MERHHFWHCKHYDHLFAIWFSKYCTRDTLEHCLAFARHAEKKNYTLQVNPYLHSTMGEVSLYQGE